MLKFLFPSKTRRELLTLFLTNPKNKYFLREINKITGLPVYSIQRELRNLQKLGLLEFIREGKQIFYKTQEDFCLYEDLKNMVLKTVGIKELLKDKFETGSIETAFIYGSYAKNTQNISSDIDLFVIGSISSRELHKLTRSIENKIKREIRFINFSTVEFREKIKTKDHFVNAVMKEPKVFIIGDNDALQKTARNR